MPRAWSRQRRKRIPPGIVSIPLQLFGGSCSSTCRPDSSRVQLRLRGSSLRTHTPDRVSGGLAFGEFKSRAILQPRVQSSHSAALCREVVESDWYDPAGQSVQPVAKLLLYVPSGHNVGSTEPIGQYSPSGHGVQRDSSSRPVLSEYVPPGHARGELEASGQKWPGEHVRQLVRLLPSWYVPARQREQTDMPEVAAKEPGAHEVGAVEAAAQAEPAGHTEQSAAAARPVLLE